MASTSPDELVTSYGDLKRSIIRYSKTCSAEEHEQRVQRLRSSYGKLVSSVRRLEEAEDVESLIALLERRLLLGWFNVDLLKEILNEFEIDGATCDDFGEYGEKLMRYKLTDREAFVLPSPELNILNAVPPNSEVIPSTIAEFICEQLGDDWIHFGRELTRSKLISERELEELQQSLLSSNEKTQKLLEAFAVGDGTTKRSQLLNVLTAIGRNDLVEDVGSMFMRRTAH